MKNFEIFFRLMLACFVCTLFAYQIKAAKMSPRNAELNSTQYPKFPVRQHWENPAVNNAWNNNNAIVRNGNSLSAFVNPSAKKVRRQQLLLPINNDVADFIATNMLRFAINVGSELSNTAYFSKSEVFSPLSIMSALAFLFAGAKGRSYEQLKPIFGFDYNMALTKEPNFAQTLHQELGLLLQDIEQENLATIQHRNIVKWRETPMPMNFRNVRTNPNPIVHIIKVANGLFAQNGYNLNPNYKDVITSIYRAELAHLDFHSNGEAARQHINAWVAKNTFGKIPNIINDDIPKSTNMILGSVLYFKGFWENTFIEGATVTDNFYPEGEGRPAIKVPIMATGGIFPYYESSELDCRIVGLPYRGNLTTMYVIQPNKSSRAKLKDFQSKITPEVIEEMISKMVHRTAIVAFPKLHLIRKLNLKEILQHFGVLDIFSDEASDLSLIGSQAQNQNTPIKPVIKTPNVLQSIRPWDTALSQNSAVHSKFTDRYHERPLFFSSRFGEIGSTNKINATNEIDAKLQENITTTVAEHVTTTPMPETTKTRTKRQTLINYDTLNLLEAERLKDLNGSKRSDLYVEDILHKVDFEVNEQGTEAAAATLTTLAKSGPDILFRADTPFIILLRHDPSKLVLFYAIINEPEL